MLEGDAFRTVGDAGPYGSITYDPYRQPEVCSFGMSAMADHYKHPLFTPPESTVRKGGFLRFCGCFPLKYFARETFVHAKTKNASTEDARTLIYEQTVNERFFQIFIGKSKKCEKVKIIFKKQPKIMKFA